MSNDNVLPMLRHDDIKTIHSAALLCDEDA